MSSVRPSLLQFLSWGDLEASALPASRPFCIFVQGRLLCCDCSVQVSWPKCDVAIMCPLGERRPAFSHTLLARFQAHLVKTAHTHESVDAQERAWPWSTENLPFVPVWFPEQCRKSESCILSAVVFSCWGKWRIQTMVPKVKNASFHYCHEDEPRWRFHNTCGASQVKLNSAHQPKHKSSPLLYRKYFAYSCWSVISLPFSLHLERCLFSHGVVWVGSGYNFFYQPTLFILIFFSCASVSS